MTRRRRQLKLVQEGQHAAEAEVELILDEDGWSPYLSLDDAYKLDDKRDALRRGDIETTAGFGQVFRLKPLAT
jgi:hypothetical protein